MKKIMRKYDIYYKYFKDIEKDLIKLFLKYPEETCNEIYDKLPSSSKEHVVFPLCNYCGVTRNKTICNGLSYSQRTKDVKKWMYQSLSQEEIFEILL